MSGVFGRSWFLFRYRWQSAILSEWGAARSIKKILLYLAIVAAVFALSIAVTPFLVNLGRV